VDILVLHEAVAPDAPPEARDTLVQVAAVCAALRVRHRVESFAVDLDLRGLDRRLRARRPDVVFNLVESLAGTDAGAVLPVALLEARGVPFTGARGAAMALANDKLLAKAHMRAMGIPTPEWIEAGAAPAPGRYIVKAVTEHASLGLDDAAVVQLADAEQAGVAIARQSRRLGRRCFAERFVDGREINLALLEDESTLTVLPPAEIDFSAFAPDTPRIVGYAAKWQETSFEYRHTPRCFDFPADDARLLDTLTALARRVFAVFHLRGYARVDFRVDAAGPWVLEVNVNPCLSPDAGFAAALAQGNVAFGEAMERLVRVAAPRGR